MYIFFRFYSNGQSIRYICEQKQTKSYTVCEAVNVFLGRMKNRTYWTYSKLNFKIPSLRLKCKIETYFMRKTALNKRCVKHKMYSDLDQKPYNVRKLPRNARI